MLEIQGTKDGGRSYQLQYGQFGEKGTLGVLGENPTAWRKLSLIALLCFYIYGEKLGLTGYIVNLDASVVVC